MTARRRRLDGGFTLVEVMMAVLIIGILVAIAVPTLRGAQRRAHDAAATTSLSTAASAAMQLSNAGSDFAAADETALTGYEPSLTFLDAGTRSAGPNQVSVDTTANGRWAAATRSKSGTCFVARLDRTGSQIAAAGDTVGCSAREAGTGRPSFTPGRGGGTGSYEGPVAAGSTIEPDGERQSNDTIFVYGEARNTLASDLLVGGAVIPGGTTVCPYLLVYDPVDRSSFDTIVEFPGPVLGVARTLSDLRSTTGFANKDATYDYRPFESGDRATVSGNRIEIDIYAIPGNADMIRAFIAC